MSVSKKILLGFYVKTGEPVYLSVHHLAIFGMTQLSGKTTALEALISRSGLKAIAFKTKRGEGGFTKFNLVMPYYKPRADWQFVEGLVNVALGEKVKFEPGMRYAIMKVCRGRKDLREIQQATRDLAQKQKSEFMRAVYEKLDAYLDIVLPELEKWTFAETLELTEGVNVMDLSGMRLETQHIVIASTIEYAFANLDHVVVIIPEAWETIPQGKMTPVKWVAQQFIRKGAALGNYLWLDSQDIGGIDKTPLRQCDNWLMGRMKEAHEVERILKQLLGMKVPAEEIQTLPLGHFYAAIGNDVKKVYVLPNGVPEGVGAQVARGKLSPEYVRDQYLKPVSRVFEGDTNLDFKQAWEEEKRKREEIEKEFTRQVERISDLKAKEKIDKQMQFIAENYVHRDEYTSLEEETRGLKKQLETIEKDVGPVKKIKEGLLELMPAPVTTSTPGAADDLGAVVVTESLPEIRHRIERPIVQTSESNLEGRLITLALHGFFEDKKRSSAIAAEITRIYAVQVNPRDLNRALGEVTQKKILQREEASNGGWEYWLYPGAKDRIKEVEAK